MLRLDLQFGEAVAMVWASAFAGVLVSIPAGLVVGVFVQLVGKNWLDSKAYARMMGLTAFLLSGFYLWHATANMLAMGRGAAAVIAMAVCPIGLAGVVWLNAGYWLRREEIGGEVKLGWNSFAVLVTLLMSLACAGVAVNSVYGSSKALSGDPNVLVITVDTLRRDHVSAFEPDSPSQTPNIVSLRHSRVGSHRMVNASL